jgi:hypothetical protein
MAQADTSNIRAIETSVVVREHERWTASFHLHVDRDEMSRRGGGQPARKRRRSLDRPGPERR